MLIIPAAAMTARWLLKEPATSEKGSKPRVAICTGERMESLILRLYKGFVVRTTDFEPAHTGGLSNEFRCYASFECESWRWREAEK
jgi:hypothetical protein